MRLASIRADVTLATGTKGAVAHELLVALALPVVVHPPSTLHVEADEATAPAHHAHGGRGGAAQGRGDAVLRGQRASRHPLHHHARLAARPSLVRVRVRVGVGLGFGFGFGFGFGSGSGSG